MDMHLKKLAMRHLETKFCRIDAEKTPFFTAKLVIETLPTICCFVDGVCRGKIIGYDGLTEGLSKIGWMNGQLFALPGGLLIMER